MKQIKLFQTSNSRSKFAKNFTHVGMVTQRKLSIRKGMTERQVRRRRRINHMIDAILNVSFEVFHQHK